MGIPGYWDGKFHDFYVITVKYRAGQIITARNRLGEVITTKYRQGIAAVSKNRLARVIVAKYRHVKIILWK